MPRTPRQRSARQLQPLLPHALYPLPVLREYCGLGENCFARLRRAGLRLPVIRVGRRCFVEGQTAIDYIKRAGELDARDDAVEDVL